MPQCPKCNSTDLRRSPTRNRWERWRKQITGKSPYRCRACHWRGWRRASAAESMPGGSPRRAAVPDPPNLKGTAFARTDRPTELDKADLDRFDTPTKDDV